MDKINFEKHILMGATIKTTFSIQKTLFDQSDTLAHQLNISQDQLFEMAIENLINDHSIQTSLEIVNKPSEDRLNPNHHVSDPIHVDSKLLVINQGDIFWIRSNNPSGADLGFYPHPYVVIQDNLFNYSRIHSVVVCALSTNLKQANALGNVLLEVGEANLPKQSAIVVSKISAVNKSQLGEYIGSLNQERISQIMAGLQFLRLSFFAR